MQGYILRRLLYAIPTVIGVSMIIFLAMRVVPGDPVVVMFGDEPELIRAEDRAKIEADLGAERPPGGAVRQLDEGHRHRQIGSLLLER